MKKKNYTVKEFSTLTNLSRKALLLYEEKKLLIPQKRSSANYRLYSHEQIEDAKTIKHLKLLGFTLEEIYRIRLLHSDKESFSKLLKNKRVELDKLIAQNKAIVNEINELVGDKQDILSDLSEKIKSLSRDEIAEKTKMIPNTHYIETVAMIDDEARENLFSILSSKAKELVITDLKEYESNFNKYW